MLATFVASVIVNLLPTEGIENVSQAWWIDRETVMVGGCVTIVLDDACRKMRGLRLTINDGDSIPLLQRAGITIQYTTGPAPSVTRTLVLISHDFRNPEGFELVSDDPVTYRIVPVFNEPGRVRLTVESEDRFLGSKVVNVIPVTPKAKPALELIYPNLLREENGETLNTRVLHLLSSAAHGLRPSGRADELPLFKKDLEVLSAHPDWAEIFAMLIARQEARIELNDLRQRIRTGDVGASSKSEPALAVAKAVETDLKGAFAKAIQDSIRDVVGQQSSYFRDADRRRFDD